MEKKDKNKGKTYKRELALALITAIFVMAFMDMLEALELLVMPVFIFAIAAFGLDSASKQLGFGRSNEEEH